MRFAIISIFLMIVTNCLFRYAFDIYVLYKEINGLSLGVYTPTIFDLNEKTKEYEIDRYVRNTIIPSSIYFYDVSDIEKKQEIEGGITWGYPILIEVPLVLLLFYGLCKMGINLQRTITMGISILLCILIGYVISKIYKISGFTAYGFNETREEILNDFSFDKESKVLKSAQENNYVIARHSNYILNIKASVQKRYMLRKVMGVIAGVLYFMFPLLSILLV